MGFSPLIKPGLRGLKPNYIPKKVKHQTHHAIAQLEAERQRYQALIALLREKGIDPEQL
ncbi:hypothetical protein [Argonema antarcticum]|uniref:hypothetical protein n=1 Tax=Argonema antarcticum TaxID=2942763 RepID=UPI0020132EF8|nr:hypothetical protein [Argonema antarcticum]MCL1469828.1 hypothetical protein [Argonema antarcticum A004/B2]